MPIREITQQTGLSHYRLYDFPLEVDQAAITNNKRLDNVLAFIQEKQKENEYCHSKSTPSRKHLGQESTSEKRNASRYNRKLV